MDFDRKIDGSCFVVGLEILDNMPHDRLYTTSKLSFQKEAFTLASVIDLDSSVIGRKQEQLTERLVPIETLNDPLINLFLQVWQTLPEMDHITANKQLKSTGILKRLVDGLSSLNNKSKSLDTQ